MTIDPWVHSSTILLAVMACALFLAAPADADEAVVIVRDGAPQAAIHVPPRVMDAKDHERLRESVADLAYCIEKMSGARIEVLTSPPQSHDGKLPILIGDYAVQHFGPLQQSSPFKQTWRLAVTPQAIGLMGESDEAVSYAIYEVLDRLGCRWFIPGEMGEVFPTAKTLQLLQGDVTDAPDTIYRGIWYGDEAFMRRNRMGGFKLQTQHALEYYITEEQRREHPEWRAVIGGKPHRLRLKWSHPQVADAIADAIIAKLDKQYQPSVSISPEDGIHFDESADRALDAGDSDPTMNTVSITDRFIVLANRVAERVTRKYPDVQLGFLAYVQYTRPPVREKLHPNLVPQIAPISYCRAHAMTDEHLCPSRAALRPIIEGWGKAAARVSYYNYMYNLAEVSAPYPMMHQMMQELPIVYGSRVVLWQPETLANFESVLPGMWLTIRKAWESSADSQAILDELFARFYGSAEGPMRRYWQVFDDAWAGGPGHAGSGWSYLQRFTPQVMQAARAEIDEARTAAHGEMEARRVRLHDDSLRQFERFMQMQWDLRDGRLAGLDEQCDLWLNEQDRLVKAYVQNYAFSPAGWAERSPSKVSTVAAHYFRSFFEPALRDAARIARDGIVLQPPLRHWRYAAVSGNSNTSDWSRPDFDDTRWKTTDVATERWADLNLADHFGSVWYRTMVQIPVDMEAQRLSLWIAGTDGRVQVFVNGVPVSFLDKHGVSQSTATGYCEPFSFDIAAAIKPGQSNQITIATTRETLNELGTGGLLGPVVLYRP